MLNSPLLKSSFAGLLALAALSAHAAPSAAEPVLLEGIVVTPKGTYSASDWQARQHARRHAVVLEAVIVTPSRNYTVAEWKARNAPTQLVYAEPQQRHAARPWLARLLRGIGLQRKPTQAGLR